MRLFTNFLKLLFIIPVLWGVPPLIFNVLKLLIMPNSDPRAIAAKVALLAITAIALAYLWLTEKNIKQPSPDFRTLIAKWGFYPFNVSNLFKSSITLFVAQLLFILALLVLFVMTLTFLNPQGQMVAGVILTTVAIAFAFLWVKEKQKKARRSHDRRTE